jgi:hypothetical protein
MMLGADKNRQLQWSRGGATTPNQKAIQHIIAVGGVIASILLLQMKKVRKMLHQEK